MAALFLWGCQGEASSPPHEEEAKELVFPEKGAYPGAFVDFGPTEDNVGLDAIEDFEKMVGKHQAIIASSSFWGEGTFPLSNLQIISRHGALPLMFWSPWDEPYEESHGPDRFGLKRLLTGEWDAYIDRWADQARAYGKPILVSWGLEMNGSWFPWSGLYYGGGEVQREGETVGFDGPETFKRAFRYVVDRVRARGAKNVLWGFHANAISYPEEPWNAIARYYPGGGYVDWLGLSVYGKQTPEDPWVSFAEVMDTSYEQICRLDPEKPVLIAEWGVGEFFREGDKAVWFQEALQRLNSMRYPRVKGAVYWHERWQNPDGTYSTLKVNSSPEALASYRQGLADPHWIDRLQYRKKME